MEAVTDEEIRKLVAQTVADTLLTLGIDARNPTELQADMLHLREWRQSVNTIKKQGLITAVGIIVAGLIGLVWIAVKGQ